MNGFGARRTLCAICGSVVISFGVSHADAQFILGTSPQPSAPAAAGSPSVLATDVAVPGYSSRPMAPYTVYLDFGGFSFTGNWVNTGKAPGVTPAYDIDGDSSSFSTTELTYIKTIWSYIAEKYAPFNINVTTVDPAVAAGQAGSDLARQNYYDSTPRLMHTVIGGNGSWFGSGGGVSYVNVTPYSETGSNGLHTNWDFAGQGPTYVQFVGEDAAHENGHGFGLSHQSDYSGTVRINEYSNGVAAYAPTMGDSYSSTRGLWALGTAHENGTGPSTQNDVQVIANDPSMGGILDDGIGHTMAAATPLPLNGAAVNYNTARGMITPASSSSPNPVGPANYTQDWWSFSTSGGAITLDAISGRSTITTGVADFGATLYTVLDIYNSSGTLLTDVHGTGLDEDYSGVLPAGTYYARVTPDGNASDSSYTLRNFYDEGDYFFTGSIPVPEPTALSLVGIATFNLRRRRKG